MCSSFTCSSVAPKGCGGLAIGARGGGALIKLGVGVDIEVDIEGAVVTAVAIGLLGQRLAGGCVAKT